MDSIKRNVKHRTKRSDADDSGSIKQTLTDLSLEAYAERATIVYGTEVVENRAVPDFRDGLKPVQRAILWAMYNLNLHHTGPYKKAARTVGDVIGQYHPRGDAPAYEAMAGMVNTPIPLVDGYGNWGSHVEEPAAMRYSMRGDSKISTEYGLIEIEKLPEFLKLTVNSDILDIDVQVPSLNGEYARASKWMYNGKRKCYKVTTKSGITLSSTKDHKYYVYDDKKCAHDFVRLEDLEVGNILCVNRKNKVEGSIHAFNFEAIYHKNNSEVPRTSSIELARFLGHLVAEGHVRFETGFIQFATTSKTSMADFEKCWKILFPDFKYRLKVEEPQGYGKKKVARFATCSPKVADFLKFLGYEACNSYEQRVPNYLFTASKEEVSAFLSRYFEGDGSVHNLSIQGSSVSTKLLTDIQLLLSSYYGIVSRIRYMQGNEYRVVVSNTRNLKTFEQEIGLISKRKIRKLSQSVMQLRGAKFASTSKDDKVFGVCDYIKSYIAKRRQTMRSIVDENGDLVTAHYVKGFFDLIHLKEDSRRFRRDYRSVRKSEWWPRFASLKAKLDEVYVSGYYYDPIVSIEYDGTHKVYDLSVVGTNAFVANGLMVHNCFVSGSKIMTELGLISIEQIPKQVAKISDRPNTLTEIRIDLNVMSTGTMGRATKWLYSGRHKTYRITTKLGYSTQCTLNQPFLQLNKNLKYVWVPLEDLHVGDHVCLTGAFSGSDVSNSSVTENEAFMVASLTKALIKGSSHLMYSDHVEKRFFDFSSNLRAYLKTCGDIDFKIDETESENKKYLSLDSLNGERIFAKFGIEDWNEYTSYAPQQIFQSNVNAVGAYLKGIFNTYTKIIGTDYYLSSRSRNLLTDVKILLLNYFGIVTSAIEESDNNFLLINVLNIEDCFSNDLVQNSTVKHYKKRHTDGRLSTSKVLDFDIIPNVRQWVNDQYINAISTGSYTEDDLQKIRSLSDHFGILNNQLAFEALPNSGALDMLNSILDKQYTYDIIVAIEECEIQDVFDLTVEQTQAFVADGFVAHNTEARLSKFSDMYLLDPEYLAVTDMRPNFSEDRMLPTVLPAKVPNMLLMGNTSIAVGISASSPPFAPRGVIDLTTECLSGTKLTQALCLKHLKFNYKYGGTCIASKADLLDFYATGKKTLAFEPSYDVTRREFIIRSTCPGLNSQNSIQTLLDNLSGVSGVKLVYDSEDKDGIRYVVQFGKISEERKALAVEAIKRLIIRKERYDFGAVERLPKVTKFMRLSPLELIEKWCLWRTEIEKLVISNRITKSVAQIEHLNLMALAIDNLEIIIESLRKTDSEKYLVQKLKISEEAANTITDMRLKQLKRMERAKVKERIMVEQQSLKTHKLMLKKPEESIIRDLKTLI